jgi:membrane-bound serine protease (ClpP class)
LLAASADWSAAVKPTIRLMPLMLGALLLALSAAAAGTRGVAGFLFSGPAQADSARPLVYVVQLDGPVGPASTDLIMRSLATAEAAGAAAFIIRMDTPGGLDKAMRDLVKRILAAEVPVITFVAPDGARAASAGTYIAYASHVAAMAPATNIGSSTPVSIAPAAPQPPRPPGPSDSDQGAAPAPQDAMTRKVINDAVAYLQGVAELRGRNVEWAEATVREGANLRASEALEQNVIDLIAADLPGLLAALEGREIQLPGRTVTLALEDARIVEVESDWLHELLEIITDPAIAYGLLIFGIYGLILEFYNPGMVFPSVIGVICLLLGAYGLQMLPINYAGLALILVGIVMMIAEVFTPTFGILGFAGVVAFVFGSIILLDTEAAGVQVPYAVIAAFAATTLALAVFAIGAAVRARQQRITTGTEAMADTIGEAMEDFTGAGRVFVFGEIWNARSDVPLVKGQQVRVVAVDGLTLTVTSKES